MKGQPDSFWGKLDRPERGPVLAWHPLIAHCADVAACAEALLQRTILRRRLAVLAGRADLSDVDVARLSVIAALHDIGKFNLGFQRKGDVEPFDTAGHVSEVLNLLLSGYRAAEDLRTALPWDDLGRWSTSEGALRLLVAAIGHHGRPVACGAGAPDGQLWERRGTLDPFAGIAELTAATRRWFPQAFADSTSDLPSAPPFQHAFSGLVMLADWLGSDRHDALFPFADSFSDRMAFSRERAARAVVRIGLDTSRARATLGGEVPSFDRVSPHLPRAAQARTMSLPAHDAGGLTVLESETGSGKTEAALGRFLTLFHAGLVDGMTFALPTRTAATQLHRRVVEAMARAFPSKVDRPAVVLAVPGYVQVDDEQARQLPGFIVLWNDNASERIRSAGWAAENPKRFLAGAVVVGTVDQVLLSSLRVGHAHLRATALLRHLLVVDEVHASDAYMNRILEEVLAFHLSAGGHAFLMSATLGTTVRERLERAARGPGGSSQASSTLAEAISVPYPVIHDSSRLGSSELIAVEAPGLPKNVQLTVERLADDVAGLVRQALDAARRGARVLILRNTVADAVATQAALESLALAEDSALLFRVRGVVTLHHARFSREDRVLLDEAIEMRFGHPKTMGGILAVTTQTVQQSLDLDADLMFTDLAPMDVLLQRFGRVHRHRDRDAFRPTGFERPRAVVLEGDEPLATHLRRNGEARGPHGVGTVYDDVLILEATLQRLRAHDELKIPEQNRELVEVTTHPEALDALATSLGGPWLDHVRSGSGKRFAHRSLAKLNLIQRSEPFGAYSFGAGERISTRLGESDRRAVFTTRPIGPFGDAIRELSIAGWLARDIPVDPDLLPADVRTSVGPGGTILCFALGPTRFAYDRLGLRNDGSMASTPEEDVADA